MGEIKHFLDLDRLGPETLRRMLDWGKGFKRGQPPGGGERPLAGKALAMVFEKPSTRTRPLPGLTIPQMMLISVVLPAPLGPSRAKISPLWISRSICLSAGCPDA